MPVSDRWINLDFFPSHSRNKKLSKFFSDFPSGDLMKQVRQVIGWSVYLPAKEAPGRKEEISPLYVDEVGDKWYISESGFQRVIAEMSIQRAV